ncbi:MAG: ABC transporter ATP-binding protein [Bradymonadales bacterium]|nr:ABC transporter ATP-binding protein [Bradymonadales bacterium]
MHFFDPVEEEERRINRLGPLEMIRRMGPLFRPHWRAFALGGVLLVVVVVSELAGPLVLRHIIDVEIAAEGDLSGLLLSALVFMGIYAAGAMTAYRQTVMMARTGLCIVADLKRRLFSHLLSLSARYFDLNPPGRLMARVESDAERLQVLFSDVALAIVRDFGLVAGTLVVMMVTDAGVTLVALASLIPLVIASIFVLRYTRGLYQVVRRLFARLSTFLAEYIQAVPILQLFGHVPQAHQKLQDRNQQKRRAEIKAAMVEYSFWSLFGTFEVIVVMVILWAASSTLFGKAMSVGTLVLFVEYTRRMFIPIAMFIEQMAFVQRAFASADRVFDILETPSLTPDREGVLERIPDSWQRLAFSGVEFAYGGREPVLDRISFCLNRGERLALVGPSGGGKTTIANLLLRFYEPTAGSISLDGTDIRQFSQRAWRRKLGLVLQEIHLFPGTLGDNLRAMHSEIPEDALDRALEVVKARQVIERLEQGYDTPLSEGGSNLSMGERQLVSFARAVVHDPEILVLDEATSSVDPITERRVQESVEAMLEGRTSLIVAHRLSTVVSADRILVIQGGRIVEEGRHEELYAGGGVYRQLFDLQFRNVGERP